MVQNTAHFLHTLQQEAKRQSPLSQSRFFPQPLDPVMAFIGNYPWQTVLVLSGVTAVILELMGWWT